MAKNLAVGVMAVLAACASRHRAGGHDNSPAYSAGFTDGCATAEDRGSGVPRNEHRDKDLARDPDYRAGWSSGYASCSAANPPNPYSP